LPLDFTAEDEARVADNLEETDERTPEEYAQETAQNSLAQWEFYNPGSFWDFQPVYIELLVEKIDLKALFLPICEEYRVPITNCRGWSDLNLRAAAMRRYRSHEEAGRRCVLLYCGDHDPVGLKISEFLLNNFRELEQAVGWCPDKLIIERFGLNADFIEAHGLSWVDNLETSSGGDLASPSHKWHNYDWVQDYIREYGARKCEANALVVRAEAGRQLCRDAIEKYSPDRPPYYLTGGPPRAAACLTTAW
jgi:hypothetical protein